MSPYSLLGVVDVEELSFNDDDVGQGKVSRESVSCSGLFENVVDGKGEDIDIDRTRRSSETGSRREEMLRD